MIALEKFTYPTLRSEKMAMPICKWIISNANTTRIMELFNSLLVDIKVKIVNNKVNLHASFRCIDKFLHSNASDSLVVHIVGGNHYEIMCSVYFVP